MSKIRHEFHQSINEKTRLGCIFKSGFNEKEFLYAFVLGFPLKLSFQIYFGI